MEIRRKCYVCHKPLGEFEGHPETVYIPASPSFAMPSGGVNMYCDKCYAERFSNSTTEISIDSTDAEKERIKKVAARVEEALTKGAGSIIITKKTNKYRIEYTYPKEKFDLE